MFRRSLVVPVLVLTAAVIGPPPVTARDLPPAEIVDDAVAGSAEVTLTGSIRARKPLLLRFASRTNGLIDIHAAAPQTAQGSWGWIQVILPAVPGTWPASTESPDADHGIGYVDWGIVGVPDPAGTCSVSWAEEPDGTIAGELVCPAQRSGKKRSFTLSATFVAAPTDAWRTCLPGWDPAETGVVGPGPASPAIPTVSAPPAASTPPASPSPADGWALPPAPAEVLRDAGTLPRCVPADPPPASSSPDPIDPCALVTPAELADETGLPAGTYTAAIVADGTCAFTDATGRGVLVAAGEGRNPRPVMQVAGRPWCTWIDLELPGIGGTETSCAEAARTWEVVIAGGATGGVGVRIVLDDPRIESWRRSTAAADLLTYALGRLAGG